MPTFRNHLGLAVVAAGLVLPGAACTGRVTGRAGATSTGGPGAGNSTGAGNGTGAGGATGQGGSTQMVAGPAVLNGMTPEQVLATCQAPNPGRSPLRRLSNAEYRNTITDLFASVPTIVSMVPAVTAEFPPEPVSLGFRNSGDYLNVPTLAAQKYMDAADAISTAAAAAPSFVTCANGTKDATCAAAFVASFGKQVYRRPLTAADTSQYTALYQKAISSGYDFQTGIEWIVYAMLQSQQFLYRFELNSKPTGAYATPSPYEMASRLSYLYWQSMPDQTLFAAADSGQLATQAQIEAQARRLLADPKASRLLEYFNEWLSLDALGEMTRDPTVFPNLDPNLPSLLQQETYAFVSDLMSSPTGDFTTLLTAPYTFANAALAKHYGFPGVTGTAFQKVATPGRSGVLTQGMMLAHDKATRTSIVRRGLEVRTEVLCQIVPAPPPNVNITLDDASQANLSQKQRLEQHRTNASCASCHNLMDPIGVVFEGFDAVGRPRTLDDSGQPVVTASTVGFSQDANGDVSDPAALGQLLAKSDEVRGCYATNTFRFFYGREVEAPDACSMARLLVDFKSTGYNLKELLVGLTRTDAFLYREVSP
ncbi:MAG TPA: DUF1592 domain-containing protein [Polyangia bacterium]|nr:DUF1592 domain-containing protein [Polyangia bacterium]